ncbi:MAG: hypothetical protein JWO37_3741 [Acidimicrobiales bacterium]|jgi:hypothetical protein|nr:hypothetical protein [Acidimicrobiales bacterium]
MTTVERAARPARRAGPVFGWALGLLFGVALTALLVPKARHVTTANSLGGSRAGVASGPGAVEGSGGSPSVGAPGASSPAGGGTSGASPSASGGLTGGPAAVAPGATVRGVTDKTIKIGIAVPDLGAVAALGPGYDDGDPQKHMASILAAWKRAGLVPVNGRDVQFVYRRFNILDDSAARAACTGLVKDESVFMVIAIHSFGGTGGDCVTSELKTPLVTSDQISEGEATRTAPWFFTLQTSESRMERNWVNWADRRGLLRGKRIGLYYFTSEQGEVFANIKAQLVKLGYGKMIVSEVASDTVGGGPQDVVAVQRFRAANVDFAWLVVDQLSQTNFMNNAQSQAYKPAYVESDYRFSTTNTATMTYPAGQFDRSYGMTFMHYGEGPAGIPPPPEAAQCVRDYAQYSGTTVDRQKRDAEYTSLNEACDEGQVVLTALQRAGRALTPATFIAALETIQDMPMGIHGNVTFTASKHDGVDTQRTMQWHGSCGCWQALGTFEPFFVP